MTEISSVIAAYVARRETFNPQDLRFHLMARRFPSDQINGAFKHWEVSYFDYSEQGQGLLTPSGKMRVAELLSTRGAPASTAPGRQH